MLFQHASRFLVLLFRILFSGTIECRGPLHCTDTAYIAPRIQVADAVGPCRRTGRMRIACIADYQTLHMRLCQTTQKGPRRKQIRNQIIQPVSRAWSIVTSIKLASLSKPARPPSRATSSQPSWLTPCCICAYPSLQWCALAVNSLPTAADWMRIAVLRSPSFRRQLPREGPRPMDSLHRDRAARIVGLALRSTPNRAARMAGCRRDLSVACGGDGHIALLHGLDQRGAVPSPVQRGALRREVVSQHKAELVGPAGVCSKVLAGDAAQRDVYDSLCRVKAWAARVG